MSGFSSAVSGKLFTTGMENSELLTGKWLDVLFGNLCNVPCLIWLNKVGYFMYVGGLWDVHLIPAFVPIPLIPNLHGVTYLFYAWFHNSAALYFTQMVVIVRWTNLQIRCAHKNILSMESPIVLSLLENLMPNLMFLRVF